MRSLRRTRSAIGMVAAVGLLLTGCAGYVDQGGGSADDLVLGSTVVPASFDPAQAGDANYVPYFQAAYDTLIRREPDGGLAPMLATDWSYDESRTVLSMALRDDVTFSDGVAFDADVAKQNLERFRDGTGPLGHYLALLEEVVVVDRNHVELHLSAPDPSLLVHLGDAAGLMASPAAFDSPDLATVPAGSGPYVMDTSATVQGSSYVFTRRDDYWNPSLQHYERLSFDIFPDETALLNALKTGQVDAGNLSNRNNVNEAERAGIEIVRPDIHVSWVGLIIFDRTGTTIPALGDERVRRAINHAFDGPRILEALYDGQGTPTQQIFSEASDAYDPALNDTYDHDPALARELMAEAGYQDGFDITMPTSAFFDQPTLQIIRQSLADIGIRVTYEDAGQDLISRMLAGDYPMSLMFLGAPVDWTLVNSYLTPDSAWNPFHAQDPELSALIDAVPAADDGEQAELFGEINQYMVDHAWFAPWFWIDETYAVNDGTDVVLQTQQNVPSVYNYTPSA
ncbi:ABC transporter substrate-binding protein [Streptomyces sp. NPDC127098]|uniref:ABC transporter substrate-binding protein n=1 Tax=Streptomyces sp. NPDC127098 TaxID=3347137 RepID=UPI003660B163